MSLALALPASGYYTQDPRDQGNLDQRLVPLSRSLARVLRHAGAELGLACDDQNWFLLRDAMRGLPAWTEFDVREVVRDSFSKHRPRFELSESANGVRIRATHKHSVGGGLSRKPWIPYQGYAVARGFIAGSNTVCPQLQLPGPAVVPPRAFVGASSSHSAVVGSGLAADDPTRPSELKVSRLAQPPIPFQLPQQNPAPPLITAISSKSGCNIPECVRPSGHDGHCLDGRLEIVGAAAPQEPSQDQVSMCAIGSWQQSPGPPLPPPPPPPPPAEAFVGASGFMQGSEPQVSTFGLPIFAQTLANGSSCKLNNDISARNEALRVLKRELVALPALLAPSEQSTSLAPSEDSVAPTPASTLAPATATSMVVAVTSSAERSEPSTAVAQVEAHAGTITASTSAAASTPLWTKFSVDEGGDDAWWWCEADENWFLESQPGPWTKYHDEALGQNYWYKDDNKWFYEHTGYPGVPHV